MKNAFSPIQRIHDTLKNSFDPTINIHQNLEGHNYIYEYDLHKRDYITSTDIMLAGIFGISLPYEPDEPLEHIKFDSKVGELKGLTYHGEGYKITIIKSCYYVWFDNNFNQDFSEDHYYIQYIDHNDERNDVLLSLVYYGAMFPDLIDFVVDITYRKSFFDKTKIIRDTYTLRFKNDEIELNIKMVNDNHLAINHDGMIAYYDKDSFGNSYYIADIDDNNNPNNIIDANEFHKVFGENALDFETLSFLSNDDLLKFKNKF